MPALAVELGVGAASLLASPPSLDALGPRSEVDHSYTSGRSQSDCECDLRHILLNRSI